jgi:hypothetical protein
MFGGTAMPNGQSKNVGYKNPPQEHRFSATNQPARRRGRSRRGESANLLQHLIDELIEPVEVTRKGKRGKVIALSAVMKQLVVKTLQGGPNDQRKLVELLIKCGYFDFTASLAEVEERHERELAESQAAFSEALGLLNLSNETLTAAMHHGQTLGEAILGVQGACTCGAHEPLAELIPIIREWRAEDEDCSAQDEHEQKAAPHTFVPFAIRKGFDLSSEEEDDPFYTGMIRGDETP